MEIKPLKKIVMMSALFVVAFAIGMGIRKIERANDVPRNAVEVSQTR
jgi:hypothetical protein